MSVSGQAPWTIRPATEDDLPVLGRLGAALLRAHYDFDRQRFMAPGANSEPEYVEGNRWSALPRTTQGFGFSTSDEPNGITKPAVFDFTQIVVVAMTEDGPRLALRDWGGNRIYEWPGFDPGPNLKALTDTQLAPLRAVIADEMKKRIETRVVPRLKP